MKKDYPLNLSLPATSQQLSPATVIDQEKLLRLNPLWIVQRFQQNGDAFEADIKDHATEQEFQIAGIYRQAPAHSLLVEFTAGPYERLAITRTDSSYTATIVYANPDFTEESEEERNTVLWLRGIQEYLRLYTKKTINTLVFRKVMDRVVLQMTPSQRKVSLMLLRITAVEVLVIFLIVIGYVFFVLRPS